MTDTRFPRLGPRRTFDKRTVTIHAPVSSPSESKLAMTANDRVSQVVAHLEQAILSGDFSPGDSLPPEREISSQLEVSRSVVREALGRLASMGLVVSQHGSGTRVLAPNSRPVTDGYTRMLKMGALDLENLVEVRLPLESAMSRKAAVHRTEEQLAELEDAQQRLANPGQPLEEYLQADVDFHAVLAAASGNPIFPMVLSPIQELLSESRRRTLDRDGHQVAFTHHQKILDAVRRQDPQAAEDAMRDHLSQI
ncbi:MAG: FadR family transcriptional regulator [Planctomycetales bacterium]